MDVKKLLKAVEENVINGKYSEAYRLLINSNFVMHSKIEEAEYNFWMGICLFERHDYRASIQSFEKIVNSSTQKDLQINLHILYYELSLSYFSLYEVERIKSHLSRALEYCKKSLDYEINNSIITESTGLMIYSEESPKAYIDTLIHLGVLYQALQEYEKSLEILRVSKAICQHYSLLMLLGKVYDEIGTTYMQMDEGERAEYYFKKSLVVKSCIKNERGINITIQKAIMLTLRHPELMNKDITQRLDRMIREERV